MAGNSGQEFEDIPSETTFMSQLCNHIFNYNNSMKYSESTQALNCQKWLTESIGHCSEKLLDKPDSSISMSFLYYFLNLHRYFSANQESDLMSHSGHSKRTPWNWEIEPRHLTKTDCIHFFIEVAKDYIHVAPKYIYCTDEMSYIKSAMKAIFGLFVIYILYRICQYVFNSKKQKWHISEHREQKLLGHIFYEKKQTAILNKIWKTAIYEYQHLKCFKHRPIEIGANQPTFAFKFQNQNILDAMCVIVDSIDPQYSEAFLTMPQNSMEFTSRMYAQHKIKQFLHKSDSFRVILDYQLESSDDEGQNQVHESKSPTNLAGASTPVMNIVRRRYLPENNHRHRLVLGKSKTFVSCIPQQLNRVIQRSICNVNMASNKCACFNATKSFFEDKSCGDGRHIRPNANPSMLKAKPNIKHRYSRVSTKCFCNILPTPQRKTFQNITLRTKSLNDVSQPKLGKKNLANNKSDILVTSVNENQVKRIPPLPSSCNPRTVVNRKPIWAVLNTNTKSRDRNQVETKLQLPNAKFQQGKPSSMNTL